MRQTSKSAPLGIDAIISAPVDVFCRISGLGRNSVFEMIADGRLESVKIGRRRLVIIDSYRRLIREEQAAQRSRR